MYVSEFAKLILDRLPYEPTQQQEVTAQALARFCRSSASHDSVFLLCGYAGTGKTTLVSALVRALHEVEVPTVLLAPTGRAAKVLAAYADYPASTIHRKIYYPPGQGKPFAAVMDNPHKNTLFIVDEASMIGAKDAGSDVLTDLIHYVYSGHYCRIIFVGDTAQLPPVGCENSPALRPEELRSYGLRVSRVQLTHTVRQAGSSGILFNATAQRKQMLLDPLERPYFNFNFDDVFALPGEDLQDTIAELYSADGIDETVLITRANWRATKFNLAIRAQILDRTEELSRDELLLVAKNNYHWAAKVRELDFIANGDTARIVRIYSTEERYGFRFADVRIEFPYRSVELDCKIILECLTSDAPALTAEQQQALFDAVYSDPALFTESTPRYVRLRAMKSNPYFQALQVKYAYAITCHKAQGGQWANVIADLGGVQPEALLTMDFHRWLYTATTRATQRLFYLNPF
ncbi:MAG: AAA family ATPase [Bacteroidales bacterium]|nr:AAA family ATPase [Bacteroidales bacterium]MBD5294150.1 AAA family ATPase [Bacteroides sp.]MBD5353194.1 AAA family ATPase [Bacteroides sp.]MBD5363411.1 AAA family ATPase [Bacteroides sp.]MBD5371879.1 AAA family ATPase [Bacteroides sp.]